jgi:tetratricopeptide (TPR) repeat protein
MNDFNQAISLRPFVAESYFHRGDIRYGMDDYEGAIADYTKTIELDPFNAPAYSHRASAKCYLDDFKGGMDDINKAIEIFPDDDEYVLRGEVKKAMGDPMGAIADYNRAIELNDVNAEAYFYRGATRVHLGNKLDGCRDLGKATRLKWDESEELFRKFCQDQQQPHGN